MKHLCFVFGYAVYVMSFLSAKADIIYPLYLAPFVIYSVLLVFSFLYSRIMKIKFTEAFRYFLPSLYFFLLLAGTPVFLKTGLPDPHNFILRKLELMLGMSYAFFLAAIIINFVRGAARNKEIESLKRADVFRHTVFFFAVVYASVSMWFNYANQPTGDEPRYLMVSHSILYDFDLDLKNNYEKKDYLHFYKKELPSYELVIDGRIISYHPVLFSLIIAPFYFLMSRLGVVLFVNAAAALLYGLIYLFLEKSGIKRRTAVITAGITGLSLPVFMFSNQIATEIISAALITAALLQALYYKKNLFAGASACVLVFLMHPRNMAAAAAIIVIVMFEYRKELASMIKYTGVQAAGAVLLIVFNYSVYGVIMPRQTSGEKGIEEAFSFNITGFLGLFFDREFGLLFYTPVFALIFAGLFFMYKRSRRLFFYMLILFLPIYIMSAMWFDWRGGGGSSPRFFVPVILFFAAATAFLADELRCSRAVKLFNGLV
ncbi:MAG TPA: hypothetical protein ENN55_00420, partial [Firmicutes bacterium]|nr:hypothetical protein [Bacillota bacterium]